MNFSHAKMLKNLKTKTHTYTHTYRKREIVKSEMDFGNRNQENHSEIKLRKTCVTNRQVQLKFINRIAPFAHQHNRPSNIWTVHSSRSIFIIFLNFFFHLHGKSYIHIEIDRLFCSWHDHDLVFCGYNNF